MKINRNRLYGLVVVAVLVAGGLAGYGAYTGAFANPVEVTVQADRSGLLLQKGSDVALRRVDVGKVLDVAEAGPDDVRITVAIDREHADAVPSTVTARVVSSTLLAPKYVDLQVPDTGVRTPIADGAVIAPTSVQTEINVAFESLIGVLDHVDPAKLNSALGALSTTLQGRGDRLGTYLEKANSYFTVLDPALPGLRRDLSAAADVSGTYADVAPELLAVLDHTTTTGRTLVEEQAPLDAFFAALAKLGDSTRGFLADNEQGLVDSLATLDPTIALAARYSPMFPCLFATVNQYRKSVEPASGGTYPGLYTSTTPLPGSEGYRAPRDFPEVHADDPTCSGGPISSNDGLYPRVAFDDGSPPLDTTTAPVTPGSRPLAVMLFGEQAAERLAR